MIKTRASHRPLMLAQAGIQRELKALFASAADQARAALITAMDVNGQIPAGRQRDVKMQVGRIVSDLFTPADNRSAYASDGVTPLAPYPRILNKWLAIATFFAVQQQEQWLRKHVPADVFAYLRTGRRSLKQVSETASEELLARAKEMRLFAPSPFTRIDPDRRWVPPHQWQDEKGYRLSDRIWRVDEETRRKIDEVLTQALRDGTDAIRISRMVAAYLNPTETRKTDKPYNVSVNYAAMRLARTEISRAFNEAAFTAGAMNPYVNGFDLARSGNGDPSCPVCQQHATIDMGGNRVRQPYSMEGGARYAPLHPHCVTPGQMVMTLRGNIPIEQIVEGDYVLTHRGRFRRVVAAWSRPYDGLVHKIQTPSSSFEITSEHPVLTADGWTDAKAIQSGNQIVYAELNTSHDRVLGVAESDPAQGVQKGIPSGVFSALEMPKGAIAFNSNPTFDKREIDRVGTNGEFPLVDDAAAIQFGGHQSLDVGQRGVSSNLPPAFQSFPDSGVMPLFDFGNLGANFGTLGGVGGSAPILDPIDLFEGGTGFSRAGSVITCPLCANTFTLGTSAQADMQQKLLEGSVLHPQSFGDFGYSKMLDDVKIADNRFDRLTGLAFYAFDMIEQSGFSVAGTATSPFAGSPTQLTDRVSHRDNLLLLSPDKVGLESGSSIVSEVANLAQAHVYYTTVEGVITRQYTGPVYNMEVEGDNSYTVNGAAVHNCMCVVRVVTRDPKEVTAELRAAMQAAQAELNINPADARAMTIDLLGNWGDPERYAETRQQVAVRVQPAPVNTRVVMSYGEVERDKGLPGDTLDSLNAFLSSSDGPLARAIKATAGWDNPYPALDLDWDTNQYKINKDNVYALAKSFVEASRNTDYSGAYLVGLIQEKAAAAGVVVSDRNARALYNREYQAEARAILTLARIGKVRLTDPQMRYLTGAADGNYFDLSTTVEQARKQRQRLEMKGIGSANMTDAARAEMRRNFLEITGRLAK